MEIKLKNTPEQVELIKAMGSKNPQVSYEATAALATYIGPVIKQVLQTAGTVSQIYKDFPYVEDSDASIPLDLFWREKAGFITVWSQNTQGGLPTSQVADVGELKFSTYTLASAVSFNKKFARKSNLTVVSAAIERMIQEVLIKQEYNGWAVALKALAEASTRTVNLIPGGTNPAKHIIAAATANVFILSDLNKLLTRIKRINESFSGNTAVQPYSTGITDLYVSPEIKEQIRAFTFNPIDTSSGNSKQNLPEDLRMQIWNSGGMQSVFGINLIEMIEFGDGEKYNTLFDFFTTGQNVPGSNSGAWQGSADQILVGIDNSRRALYRPVETSDDDNNSEFTVQADNQFQSNGDRTDSKVGWYGKLTEGRVCADARVLVGVAV